VNTRSEERQKNGTILEKNVPPRIKESKPLWFQIEDRGQERELLRLWLANVPAKEIALTLNISKDRVYNIVSDLRRRYGEAFVPYRDEKRRRRPPT
jgi:DNA invertase Pin-like site-specific DNA recombinase